MKKEETMGWSEDVPECAGYYLRKRRADTSPPELVAVVHAPAGDRLAAVSVEDEVSWHYLDGLKGHFLWLGPGKAQDLINWRAEPYPKGFATYAVVDMEITLEVAAGPYGPEWTLDKVLADARRDAEEAARRIQAGVRNAGSFRVGKVLRHRVIFKNEEGS